MARKREEYRRLKADHRMDIAKVLDTTDPMSANPLFSGSGSGDDPWSHFYERKEMTETIKADLERLFPTGCGDHFLAPARQELLLSVLSLWADLNTATSYRQLYGMKWARLMFGREFRVEAVMLLWDHIFASSWIEGRPNIPECIENVAVAMVVSIRDQLLSEDCTGCLQLLMRYPPDQSVKAVISQALATSSGRYSQPFASPAPAAASLVPRLAEATATAEAGAPPFASQVEPSPAWLNRSGRDAGGMSGGHRSPPAPRRSAGMGHESDHRRGGGDAWMGLETERETKHNWQQGLDDFTRRALSAAQGVAKMAVQTVERSQGGGTARQRPGVAATEAFSYARRLRAACASMEAGDTSVSLAMQEIKEVARLLEERSQGGPTAGRFSTYSEDDGCADALYTQDL
ncbi:unnamed protein product [Scytosiphon promiscuus]